MPIRKVTAAVLAATVVMAACQHPPPTPPPAPPQQVETGSTFTLLSPLTFSTGRSELLFQGQRQVTADALSKNLPYCKLVPLAGAARSVTPGPLRVSNVNYDERESGESSAMFSITRIVLAPGAGQPGYTMSCGWPVATSGPAFLTTEQIYNAIGGQFSMQLVR
jgi:hypothetical protein